jgi:hypothetical protein
MRASTTPSAMTSSNGRCCSFADGFSVSDAEWDTEDGHYRVLLHGEWINVPNSSVVTEPTRIRLSQQRGLPNRSFDIL